MNNYQFLKDSGENFQAEIVKNIPMGDILDTDIMEIVDKKYLGLSTKLGDGVKVFIKAGATVEIRYCKSNGWIEIGFDDTISVIDIAFDEIEKYDDYFKIF